MISLDVITKKTRPLSEFFLLTSNWLIFLSEEFELCFGFNQLSRLIEMVVNDGVRMDSKRVVNRSQ